MPKKAQPTPPPISLRNWRRCPLRCRAQARPCRPSRRSCPRWEAAAGTSVSLAVEVPSTVEGERRPLAAVTAVVSQSFFSGACLCACEALPPPSPFSMCVCVAVCLWLGLSHTPPFKLTFHSSPSLCPTLALSHSPAPSLCPTLALSHSPAPSLCPAASRTDTHRNPFETARAEWGRLQRPPTAPSFKLYAGEPVKSTLLYDQQRPGSLDVSEATKVFLELVRAIEAAEEVLGRATANCSMSTEKNVDGARRERWRGRGGV
jgi:hypothetical protein